MLPSTRSQAFIATESASGNGPLRRSAREVALSRGHQDREGGFVQDVLGRAAEDHLPQPAVGVGAFDQEVGAEPRGLGQDRFAGRPSLRLDRGGLRRDAAPAQSLCDLCCPGSGDRTDGPPVPTGRPAREINSGRYGRGAPPPRYECSCEKV